MNSPVFQALRDGLRVPERLSPQKWGERNVKIPHSARSDRFDGSLAPWLNAPMQAVADNRYSEVMVCAPVGSGKTTLFEILIPYFICQDPGYTMAVFQNDGDATEWSETRLMPILEKCPPVLPFFPRNRHAKRKNAILFPHMPLIIAGANPSSLQSKSVRWCIGDEVWLWKKGLVEEFRRRTHDRWNSRLILVSQAGVVGDDFHTACMKGEQMEWHWRCPNCESENLWRQGDLFWEDVKTEDGEWDWAATAATVHMICPSCQARFEDTTKTRRLLSDASFYKALPHSFVPGKITFHYPAEAVWWIGWGKLIIQWLTAQEAKHKGDNEPLRQYLQKRRAQFWEEHESAPWGALTGAGYTKAEYVGGQLWPGEVRRFLTVDVQRDHYWYSVRAWKADGSSRLLSEGRAVTIEGIRAIQEQYGVKNRLTFLDAQWHPGIVYDACVRFDWTALHGSGRDHFRHIPRKGKPISRFYSAAQKALSPGGGEARYVFWSNERIKDALAILRSGSGAAWETPDDVSDFYIRQIDSEMKKEVVNKKTKQVDFIWKKIKDDNHLWDTECMQIAAAMMMGLLRGEAGGVDAPA